MTSKKGVRRRPEAIRNIPPLGPFGEYLKQKRQACGIASQRELGEAIGKSQSFVAQLEAGNVVYPDRDLLQLLARHLGLDYPEVVQTYVQSRFGLSVDAPSVEKAVGLEVRDVDSLAAWEKALPSGELWIVVRNFVDQDVQAIQDAVATFVRKGGRITYFSDDRAHFEGAKETILARASGPTQNYSQMEDSIYFEYVPPHAIRFMMAGVVIYNPRSTIHHDENERAKCEAFLIVNDGNSPDYGIRVTSELEKRRIYTNIRAFLSERQLSQGDME